MTIIIRTTLLVASFSWIAAGILFGEESTSEEAETTGGRLDKLKTKLFDPEDGYLDLSETLNHPLGFVPLVIPITEPALGGGAAFTPVFIDKPDGGGRPNVAIAGAMRTSNDSEALFGGYSGYFLDQRLHVIGGIVDASINLDFYGFGDSPITNGRRLLYNLEAQGGLVGADWKIGESDWNIGLRYAFADIDASLVNSEPVSQPINFGSKGFDYTISSLRPSVGFDSRDNIFTPTRGFVSELSLTANLEALGGDTNFQNLNWTNLWYHPLIDHKLFLGLKGQIEQSFGDEPFYMRPYVKLRGAPAMRFQGEGVSALEAELRWQFHPRWSLVGFGGAGFTWTGSEPFEGNESTYTGGGGFRYVIAREYGLHMGIDVAYGEEGTAVYVQFGSAWNRF